MFKVKKKHIIGIAITCIIIVGLNAAKYAFVRKRQCYYPEYKKSFRKMGDVVKAMKSYEERCGALPEDISLEQFLDLKICPNGGEALELGGSLSVDDEWGNPLSIKRKDGKLSLISCGTEWIEVDFEEESSYRDSVKKLGKAYPYAKDVGQEE